MNNQEINQYLKTALEAKSLNKKNAAVEITVIFLLACLIFLLAFPVLNGNNKKLKDLKRQQKVQATEISVSSR